MELSLKVSFSYNKGRARAGHVNTELQFWPYVKKQFRIHRILFDMSHVTIFLKGKFSVSISLLLIFR